MLSKCANPACEAKFRYLHTGKLFVFRHRHGLHGAPPVALEFAETLDRHSYSWFWLCEECSRFMTVKASRAGEIRVVPTPEKPAA